MRFFFKNHQYLPFHHFNKHNTFCVHLCCCKMALIFMAKTPLCVYVCTVCLFWILTPCQPYHLKYFLPFHRFFWFCLWFPKAFTFDSVLFVYFDKERFFSWKIKNNCHASWSACLPYLHF